MKRVSYLRTQHRIYTPVLKRNAIALPLHDRDTRQLLVRQHAPHLVVRLDSNDVELLISSRERFRQLARPGGQIEQLGVCLAADAQILEQQLDDRGRVGGAVSVVG